MAFAAAVSHASPAAALHHINVPIVAEPTGTAVPCRIESSGAGWPTEVTHVSAETDAAGRILWINYDRFGNNTLNERWTYQYDANGNAIEITEDDDGDGGLEDRVVQTFGEHGILSEIHDFDDDGVPDYRTDYTYDGQGRLATISEYNLMRDLLEMVVTFDQDARTYVFDAYGDNTTEAMGSFELDDEGIAVFREGAERESLVALLDACASCPVDAITVWDGSGEQIIP